MITGLVSPKYHVRFDENFVTTDKRSGNPPADVINWQIMAGFKRGVPKAVTQDTMYLVVLASEGDHEPPDNMVLPGEPHSQSRALQGPHIETKHVSRLTYDERQKQTVMSLRVIFNDVAAPKMKDPIAFAVSTNKDIMYLHEAKKESDWSKFHEAMRVEVSQHIKGNHWQVVPRNKVPPSTKVLPSVWAMRQKRRLGTGEVYKYKACLNMHGGKQQHGVNFWETYSPVVQ